MERALELAVALSASPALRPALEALLDSAGAAPDTPP
jgi:hypothetical protein